MASKQRHDWGFKKRQISEPIRRAAEQRRKDLRAQRQTHPEWFLTWLRTNQLPTWKEFYEWEAGERWKAKHRKEAA